MINDDFMSLEHVCDITEQHKTNVTDAFSFGGVFDLLCSSVKVTFTVFTLTLAVGLTQ